MCEWRLKETLTKNVLFDSYLLYFYPTFKAFWDKFLNVNYRDCFPLSVIDFPVVIFLLFLLFIRLPNIAFISQVSLLDRRYIFPNIFVCSGIVASILRLPPNSKHLNFLYFFKISLIYIFFKFFPRWIIFSITSETITMSATLKFTLTVSSRCANRMRKHKPMYTRIRLYLATYGPISYFEFFYVFYPVDFFSVSLSVIL